MYLTWIKSNLSQCQVDPNHADPLLLKWHLTVNRVRAALVERKVAGGSIQSNPNLKWPSFIEQVFASQKLN